MRKLKSCGVLIVRGNPLEEFLLMQHASRLDLPKGHVDPGETEVQCAFRELEEETGITQADVELQDSFRFTTDYFVWPPKYQGEKCHKTLVVFLGLLLRDVAIQPTEHLGYQWCKWDPPHRIQTRVIDPLLAMVEEWEQSRAK